MVKPGGTGRPMRLISARLAPFPPSKGFMLPSPSAFLFPNKSTYFSDFEFVAIKFLRYQVSTDEIPKKQYFDSNKAALSVNERVANRQPILSVPQEMAA